MGLMIVLSMVIYIIGIIIVYHYIPAFTQDKKVKFIIMGIIVAIIVTMIICNITTGKIKGGYQEDIIKGTKNTSILIFSPINFIILIPYIANALNKFKENIIEEGELKKRFFIIFIILILLIIFELGYISEFQGKILNIGL